jgi:hypothetical protein
MIPKTLLQNLNLPVHNLHFGMMRLDPTHGFFEDRVDTPRVIGDGDESDLGRLPGIVVRDLSGSQVELAPQLSQERLEDAALAFQRTVAGEIQLDVAGTNDHSDT